MDKLCRVESILNECGLSSVWLNQYFKSKQLVSDPIVMLWTINMLKLSKQRLKTSVKTCLQDQFW
jgi:hypothetical protein